MNLGNGVSKRSGGVGGKNIGKTSRKSKKTPASKKAPRRMSRKSSKRFSLPRTAIIRSRKSVARTRASRANSSMSLTELQIMAKSRGVPFGGLSRAKLIKKINNYMY